MQDVESTRTPPVRIRPRMPSTGWTKVLHARRGDSGALNDLCIAYREPLRQYILSRGYSEADASDSVQRFLMRITAPGVLENVSPLKGRFRSWLLKSLKHHLETERVRNHARKRGGGIPPVPLDTTDAECPRIQALAERRRTPEEEYDYRWALTVIERAWSRLHADVARTGRRPQWELITSLLYRDQERPSYLELARELRLSESGARSAIKRMRDRLRCLILDELAMTIADPLDRPEEVEVELRDLIAALCGQ